MRIWINSVGYKHLLFDVPGISLYASHLHLFGNVTHSRAGQDLRAVSLSTFNDILSVVAPPIAEHEVIQVWLSHDLEGYDGVETLVYRALARVNIGQLSVKQPLYSSIASIPTDLRAS